MNQPIANNNQEGEIANRLNWLRAGVMGANDGIVSTAAMVIGVAGAAVSQSALMAAVLGALAITGSVSAHLGHAPRLRAMIRTTAGGILAMAITYVIGALIGGQI